MRGADEIYAIDMGHNYHLDVLTFKWNKLGFEVDVIDGVIKRDTLRCLAPIVKQMDFPSGHKVWKDLEDFVSNSV